jgi:putative SOS response-associated peptidase YedK
MCGRFTQTKSKQDIKKRFNAIKVADSIVPMFNIAPNQNIPVILNESPEEVTLARWGLVPSWSKEEKTACSMINARAETLLEKPSYKRLVKSKRCLIIADSFIEWKKTTAGKVPHRIMLKDGDLFAFAGLWDLWEKEGVKLTSCTIITTSPNKLVGTIHDRMPVMLPKKLEEEWLSDIPVEDAMGLLESYDYNLMTSYEISTLVNSPIHNTEDVIKRLI